MPTKDLCLPTTSRSRSRSRSRLLEPVSRPLVLVILLALILGFAPYAVAQPSEEKQEIEEALEELGEEIDQQLEELGEALAESDEAELDSDRTRVQRERARREVLRARERVRSEMRGRRPDSKVSVGDSIRIDRGEQARDLVVIGGSIHSEGDVTGDCVAIGGSVYIDGEVTGDVVAVGGAVELGENAEVLGDVTAVGGGVIRADGAEVLGEVNEVAFAPALALGSLDWGDWDNWGDWGDAGRWGSPFMWGGFGFAWELFKLMMWLVLGSLVLLLGGRSVEKIRSKVATAPWASLLVGLAVEILLLPVLIVVSIILLISIVGILLIPVLWLVVLFGLMVAALVGITSVAVAAGQWVARRLGQEIDSPYLALAFGLLVIYSLSLVGDLFQIGGGFLFFFAFMFALAGGLMKLGAWTMGLGAVILNAFGSSRFSRGGGEQAYSRPIGTVRDEESRVPPLPVIDSPPRTDSSDLASDGDGPATGAGSGPDANKDS